MTAGTNDLKKLIYLDNPATTPCDPRVIEAMLPYFLERFGNPHARNHAYGWTAESGVDTAQEHIAKALGCEPREVIFTSGATEANTMALRGVLGRPEATKGHLGRHIITTQTEHKSILSCCQQLEQEGVRVTYLPVGEDGRIVLDDLEVALKEPTELVSIAAVNNETGVIQPLQEIGALCQAQGTLFHTDATQALGKMALDLKGWNVALASFSAHKVYGPKGIGALYLRRQPSIRLRPILPGGGQQKGIRGGTLPVPLCVGFGEACRIVTEEGNSERARIANLSRRLVEGLSAIPHAHLNGDPAHKVPHIVNMGFPYVEGESLAMGLETICVSTGSACSSERLEPSYVLRAMKADELVTQSSIRFGLGRFTTEAEIETTLVKVAEVVQKLRELSPLWEMVQNGINLDTIEWR